MQKITVSERAKKFKANIRRQIQASQQMAKKKGPHYVEYLDRMYDWVLSERQRLDLPCRT